MADARESIELAILAALQGITQANGYVIPRNPKLVTREQLDFSQTQHRRPALLLIMGAQTFDELVLDATEIDSTLRGVVRLDHDPEPGQARATIVNQWGAAIHQAFQVLRQSSVFADVADDIMVTQVDQPAIAEIESFFMAAFHFEGRYVVDVP